MVLSLRGWCCLSEGWCCLSEEVRVVLSLRGREGGTVSQKVVLSLRGREGGAVSQRVLLSLRGWYYLSEKERVGLSLGVRGCGGAGSERQTSGPTAK